VAFNAGKRAISPSFALEANVLFAPIFEAGVLELWNNRWGGKYTLNDAIVEIVVDFRSGSIQLARLESEGKDWLGIIASDLDRLTTRSDVISYLWPGSDDSSWR
jgi:hypothetical protein